MARIVLFTSGTLGDHLPFIALAQRLQSRGHDLVMVINQAMHVYAHRAGIEAVAISDIDRGPQEARENAWAWDHWHNPLHKAHEHPRAQHQSPEIFVKQIRELAEYVEGADLLMATAIRPHGLAAHLVTGVPWITLSVNPSAFAHSPADGDRDRAFELERRQYLSVRELIDMALQACSVRALPPSWRHGVLWAEHVILGSSPHFSKADDQQLQPFASLDQTGFWFWDDPAWADWQPTAELAAFCDRSPLLLTFSSQPLEDPTAVLAKHVRAAQILNLPLLVQSGWAGFAAADLPSDVDRSAIFFVDYAPHDWLFARARCAIQHGGIGSLARAIRRFCPVIVEPFGNDQFYNAQRTTELGVGVALHPFKVSAPELASAIGDVALSKQTRLRTKILGRNLGKEDGVGHACGLIESYLDRSTSNEVRRSTSGAMLNLGRPETYAGGEGATSIPHIIHQTWKTADIPSEFHDWTRSWKNLHPDWQYRLWTDDDCRRLIEKRYPWFLDIYDKYPLPIMRVDAARYFIMHHNGGVYVDLDYEALKPLDPLLAGRQIVLTTEPPAHLTPQKGRLIRSAELISNAFLASIPGHEFWSHLFDELVAEQDEIGPLDAAGPYFLTRTLQSFDNREAITIESHQKLSPLENIDPWYALPEATRQLVGREAYALHHWFGSWWRDPVVSERAAVQIATGGQMQQGNMFVTRKQLMEFSARGTTRPLISCLMVTRDRPLLAQMAINAFQRQSYSNRELIVVDDGPDDRLANWLAEQGDPRLRLVRLPDEGHSLGALRNIALDQARGEWIAQWDDDDLSAPLRLELQRAAVKMFGGRACLLSRQLLWRPRVFSLAKSVRRVWEGSALLPRSDLLAYPDLQRGEDTPVVDEIVRRVPAVFLDMPELYLYVDHGRNSFDDGHWSQQQLAATVRYESYRYLPALREASGFLGVNLERLAEYHLQSTPLRPRRAEKPDIDSNSSLVGAIVAMDDPLGSMEAPAQSTSLTPTVLILTPVKDASGALPNYLRNLRALDYPRERLSLGFLEGDSEDDSYGLLDASLHELRQEFARVELLRRPYGFRLEGPRWEPGVQYRRRSVIARSRNALLQASLHEEEWVLWIDADLIFWPKDAIYRLLAVHKKIVVANCLQASGERPFDLNTWKMKPGASEIDFSPYIVDDLLQPPPGLGRDYLTDLRQHELVEVDAVGGTMLLVKADLHRDGLNFPPYSYKHLIDTEGLAAMARDMGVACYGLPNLVVRHS